MPRLPRVTGLEVMRALERTGWYADRQKGSHISMRHTAKAGVVVVAIHAGRIIPPGTLSAILQQAGLSPDELRRLL